MASRRMFSNRITNSGRFLQMSQSAQALYFHLGMKADDDGVVEAYGVMKLTNSADDDFKVLVAKGFIKPLNADLVSFIIDWNEHNLIRADRKVNSIYKDLLMRIVPDVEVLDPKPRADTKVLPRGNTGRPVDNQRTAQVRLGKVREGEESVEDGDALRVATPSDQARWFFTVMVADSMPEDAKKFLCDLHEKTGIEKGALWREVKAFVMYWTELSKNGKKQRWEMQPTFQVERRLNTWLSKEGKFSTGAAKQRGREIIM